MHPSLGFKMEQQYQDLYAGIHLGNETFALPISEVQEVVFMDSITPLHSSPNFLLGVMNLRGRIVCVADLAVKIGVSTQAEKHKGRVVIVHRSGVEIGFRVDALEDIFELENEMESKPTHLPEPLSFFISGVINHRGEHINVLNLEALMSDFSAEEYHARSHH